MAVILIAAAMLPASAADSQPTYGNASPASVPLFLLPFIAIASKRIRTESPTTPSSRHTEPQSAASTSSVSDNWVNEMVGSHRISWHFDHDWSSSLGSDYPRLGTAPSYVIGNGDPGVAQKVWVRFNLVRHF